MLQISNDLLDLERGINLLEHYRMDYLGNGNPVVSDEELRQLNVLQGKIFQLKNEFSQKTVKLNWLKTSYYKALSQRLGLKKSFPIYSAIGICNTVTRGKWR